ncbi:MAG: DNA polymerase-3 subunit epsilon [Gammaproteobacteria bacterium]|jgi:DNA polymerase-3 subunit epsilon
MSSTVAVLDFETTGLSPDMGDRTTEVAVVVMENGRPVAEFQSLMNADVKIPAYVTELTKISNAMIREAPPIGEVMRELSRFIGDLPLIAHNASFDRKFLDAEFARIRIKRKAHFICSMRVARRIYPTAPNHKLGTLVAYTGIPVSGQLHRALADAQMTASLWTQMQTDLRQLYRLRAAPLELMRHLESTPRREVNNFVDRYRQQHGL